MAKIIDNYILVETIGIGSFSETQKGRNLINKEIVAVKTIKLDKFMKDCVLRDMIINEIQILKKIVHPQVIKMIKMLKSANNIYLVYEYLNGGMLSQRIHEKHKFSEQESLPILLQILDVLEFLEEEQLVHNNLNSDNIFFHNNEIKVKGFLCSFAEQISKKFLFPENIYYSAPEIIQICIQNQNGMDNNSHYQVKPAADIYSLGIMIFQMLTGELLNVNNNYSYPKKGEENCIRPPLELCSELFQLRQSIAEQIAKYSNKSGVILSKNMKDIILKMLDKEIQGRPSAKELKGIIINMLDRNLNSSENILNVSEQLQPYGENQEQRVLPEIQPQTLIQIEKKKQISNLNSVEQKAIKKLNRIIMYQRNKIQFVLNGINLIQDLEDWNVKQYPRELYIFLLFQKILQVSQELLVFIQSPDQLQVPFKVKAEVIAQWERSLDYELIVPIITEEAEAVQSSFSKYYSEKIQPQGFENQLEMVIVKQIDLSRKFNEDDYVQILFQLIKALYAAEIKEERLSPIFDNLNQDRLKVLNSLLEILFLDEFFEHFITKNENLCNQEYFLKLKDLSMQNLLELIQKKMYYSSQKLDTVKN